MSNNDAADAVQQARDSYGSLLDYYYDRPASKESIKIGLRLGDVPTEAQAEELQRELAEVIQVQTIINLSPQEKAHMQQLAAISQSQRKKKQMNK
ncbi:hypothetical protein FQN50_000953 [Emmonsiellopsis sp. PD_5]|nr:hypothetical protein FQN50_000953 [Emmonsiellopsis sp. PD_5]